MANLGSEWIRRVLQVARSTLTSEGRVEGLRRGSPGRSAGPRSRLGALAQRLLQTGIGPTAPLAPHARPIAPRDATVTERKAAMHPDTPKAAGPPGETRRATPSTPSAPTRPGAPSRSAEPPAPGPAGPPSSGDPAAAELGAPIAPAEPPAPDAGPGVLRERAHAEKREAEQPEGAWLQSPHQHTTEPQEGSPRPPLTGPATQCWGRTDDGGRCIRRPIRGTPYCAEHGARFGAGLGPTRR